MGTLAVFAVVGAVMLVALVRAAAPEEVVPVGARPDDDVDARPVLQRARDRDRRNWERLLERAGGSASWQRWHVAAAGLWSLGTVWLAVQAVVGAFAGSVLALAWALLALVWLNAAHRAVLLVRREPEPPAPFWPLRGGAVG